MLPRAALVTSLAVGAVAAARAPAAADEAVAWRAPDGCPAAEAVRGRVVAHLGRPLRDGEVTAELRVARRGGRWHVEITVATAAGEGVRQLDAASCDELAEAAALILALTIDPLAGAGPPGEPPGEPGAAPPPEDAAAPDTTDEIAAIDLGEPPVIVDDESPPAPGAPRRQVDISEREPDPPRPFDLRARAVAGGDLGSLPGAAPGWGAAVEVALGPWSVDLAIERFGARDAPMPGTDDSGARVDLVAAAARGCYSGGPARWRAGGCAGAEVSWMGATGYGFDVNFPTRTMGGGVQTGVVGAVRVAGPVWLRADVSATWMVVRPVLVEAMSRAVVHDPNVLTWRGFAGVEATWR